MNRLRWMPVVALAAALCGWGAKWTVDDRWAGRADGVQADGVQADGDLLERAGLSRQDSPKAFVDPTDFDFGLMDMTTQCEHTFLIHNRGTAPLILRRGSTTCKCTMSDLPSGPIPPGGKAAVRIASKIDNREGPFSHGARILTNDPTSESIELRIRGTIRKFLAIEPSRIVFHATQRDEIHTQRVVLYSEVWNEFRIVEVTTSLEGIHWKVAPTNPRESIGPQARSGVQLEITMPPKLPAGEFWERMQVAVVADDEPDSKHTTTLDLTGTVAGRFSLYGESLLKGKVVRLGTVRADRGARTQLLLKVRDEHRKLTFGQIDVEPAYLQVRVQPKGPTGEELGLYQISLDIPPNAPAGNYMSGTPGRVRIETDHPYLALLTLDVAFAVQSEPPSNMIHAAW